MRKNEITPSWIDTTFYPFDSKFLQLSAGKMHYVEEGEGDVLLFVHGTPTWSFLYRDFIKMFSKSHRCIAIDHLGFGLSEKHQSFLGTPKFHAENLSEFIQKKGLKNITLIVHDFGGPIGIAAGIKNASSIQKVILFNSWLWAIRQDKAIQKADKVINSWLGKFLYLNLNFSSKSLLKKGFSNKKNLSKQVHQHYIKPFPTKNSRLPLLKLAKALVGESNWYQQQWEQLNVIADRKWLILWGEKDDFFDISYLKKWADFLPNVEKKVLSCGHFVQEEKTSESIEAMKSFLS
ncbi:MAG: alpha/beta fold hydrolase [Bacteroidota bacterium]